MEYFHLLYCDLVQFLEAFALREAVVYQHRVDVFEVRHADELVYLGVVAHVALQVGVGVAPLFGGLAEECHVQHVGFGGVDVINLAFVQPWRDEVLAYRAGVDVVVDSRELAFRVSAEMFLLIGFEPLVLLYQKELKPRAYPHPEMIGNVLVGVCAAAATGLGDYPDGIGILNPSLR